VFLETLSRGKILQARVAGFSVAREESAKRFTMRFATNLEERVLDWLFVPALES
jgi:hypothetical protein